MKIFETGQKINFVDDNNVFVGYDLGQDCCEYADWFISYKEAVEPEFNGLKTLEFDGWCFDTTYFKKLADAPGLDEGGIAIFRLVFEDKELFLHLFNCHNGYYAHGFMFGVHSFEPESADTFIKTGLL